MLIITGLLTLGSLLIALIMTLQVKFIDPVFIKVLKFNIYMIPLMVAANVSLGMGFIKGQQIFKNFPFLLSGQTFIYYIMILIFSVTILGDKLSILRVLIAYLFMVVGIWIIKS
ncbi:hypothetical protein SAMN00017405_1427 [Desulfonispora thiosulfatigenes DSM 11270]|uniref:EamA domain-containing protein n=1 Tax=Desulfonispora thiosulfatigenes DSM 11270 TaxID=656914 RepID=A0A1W1VCW2_DESTI|nr:hypothetical protein [Desulfonispora thiosulfatigenes]SMB91156.1 hypothetical protein SAMN00017405_1427 [Desulfonispora thiosulfatigenes DSM 11270]